ncbi:CHAT domain-containing protein [Streptomyces sp. 1222.5]|uniref:CHAT domain-containing protein n=1 Tax=Streptomyces sp. 1222.5 TaxID=1881026 RepID=UPI003EBF8186
MGDIRRSQDTRVIATVSEVDGVARAEIVVGNRVWWPVASVIGRSPSMLTQAYEGGLPQIASLGLEAYATQAPVGWAVWFDAEKDELSITSPTNPRFHYGVVPPLPLGWRETAAAAGRVLLMVTGYVPELPAGADPTDLLEGLASRGVLHGGMIDFVEAVVPREVFDRVDRFNHGNPPALTGPGASIDLLLELAELVGDRVFTLGEARARARRVAWLTRETQGNSSGPEEATESGFESIGSVSGDPSVQRRADDPKEFVREMTDSEIAARALPADQRPPEGAVREQYYYLRLLVEVAEARGGPQRSSLWLAAAGSAIAAAAHLYSLTGDEVLFDDADELSVRRLALVRSQSPRHSLEDALVAAAELRLAALGPLHFSGDVYARGSLTCIMAARVTRGYCGEEDGREQPPDLAPRIAEANALLEEALGTLVGPSRARALVLRIQCGAAREQPYSLSGEQIRALATEARACLKEGRGDFPDAERLVIDLFLARLLKDLPLDEVGRTFALPVPWIVATYGEAGARALLSQGIEIARSAGDRDLLRHVLRWSAELPEPLSDGHARQELEAQLHCLSDDVSCAAADADLAGLARRFLSPSQRLRLSKRGRTRVEAARAHLAAHALAAGQIGLGLRLLPAFESLETLGRGFSLLYADLRHQAAGTLNPRMSGRLPGNSAPAILLGQAAQEYSLLSQYGLAGACLIRMLKYVAESSDDHFPYVAAVVAGFIPEIHANRDPQLARICRDVVHAATLRASLEGASLDLLLALHHAAKGPTFSQRFGMREPFQVPEAVTHQLVRLQAVAASRTAGVFAPLDHPPDHSDVLSADIESVDPSSPLSGQEALPGRTAAEIEQNLKRHIDYIIHRALIQPDGKGTQTKDHLDRLQESLDDRTVFLSWFLPATAGPESVYTMLAVTRESADVMVVRLPSDSDAVLEMSDEAERRPGEHILVRTVSALRSEVTRHPFFDDVTPTGTALLAQPLVPPEWLQQWRDQGKDHLRIWPHGPLHYLPFHLCAYGAEERLIADDFTVSLIAGLGTSSPPSSPTPRPARTAILASAGGGEEFGLERETILEEHADDIAAWAGTDRIVAQAATRQRLLDELSTADVVHVAAHGAQDAAAPWFHCLYLSPDEDDDGRVFAHDILAADLRGVRLVTLGSCESAVGRYDINDNLRGMPAALLLAGAQAVIGCLWPVRPQPATRFFGELHRRIAQGSAPLAAFRGAQLATRALFPKYRDWGAFVVLQAGRHTVQEAT